MLTRQALIHDPALRLAKAGGALLGLLFLKVAR